MLAFLLENPMSHVSANFSVMHDADLSSEAISHGVDTLVSICHNANIQAGWWEDLQTGNPIQRNTGELLMLCVSELSEAMEGDRKNLQDDKLPQYRMFDVELADCLIRIFDLAGAAQIPLGEVFTAKLAFNTSRSDHKREARLAPDGKKY